MVLDKYKEFKAELALAESWEELKTVETKAAAVAEITRRSKFSIEQQNEWGKFRTEIERKKGGYQEHSE